MANIIIGGILAAAGAGAGVVIHYQYYVKVEYNWSLLRPQLILKKKISCSQNLGFGPMDCTQSLIILRFQSPDLGGQNQKYRNSTSKSTTQSLITPEVQSLLLGKNFASFATLMKDGSPHVAPTWIDYDGQLILVNTAVGRVKEKNVGYDNRVALSIFDSANPYNMATIRGTVEEITAENADSHADKLAKRYLGLDQYPFRSPTEQRIILKIKPTHVFHQKPPN